MQSLNRALRRFAKDKTGSPSLEFAFVAMPLFLLVAGIIEFGAILLIMALMEGGLRDAARFGITGQEPDGSSRLERILAVVERHTVGLVDMNEATIETLVYPSFSDIGRGEPFVDGNGNGSYDAGETFDDENGNAVFDADIGEDGVGGAGEVVLYRIRYDWPLLTPLLDHVVGQDGLFALSASVAVRNEPYDIDGPPAGAGG